MPTGIYKRKPHSILTKIKISRAMKGKKPSIKTRNASILAWKGKHHSLDTLKKMKESHRTYQTEETKRKLSESRKGKNNPFFGKHHLLETKKKIGESLKGEKGSGWKGGINPVNDTIRKSINSRLWRDSIFIRDNWSCRKCEKRNGNGKTIILRAHHILNFAQYPELRFAIDNGITFCKNCHNNFHKKYGYKNNDEKQINEFLCLKK